MVLRARAVPGTLLLIAVLAALGLSLPSQASAYALAPEVNAEFDRIIEANYREFRGLLP